ncbi:MAG: MurR/RpiR family transcriptional regulator [Lachnospiraceae bacterium]|jgi:DNA-binding MurR/RpiR family transcriptional regulator
MSQSNYVEIKIRDAKSSMTKAEFAVAEYVESHLSKIPMVSVKQLAKEIGTSEASVVRFCKALGYHGYRDFVISLSAALGSMDRENDEKKYTDIRPGDDMETIIKNVSFNNQRSIEDTFTALDKTMVAKAVKLLCEAKRVDWYGLGASALVCQDAQQKFMRISKHWQAFVDGHSIQTAAALLNPCDVVVLISNSGTTMEMLDALELARENGAKTIAITRYSKSELAQGCDIVLHISTPEVSLRSGAMGSRIAMLNVVDILFSCVASEQYNEVKKYLDKTRAALKLRHR